MRNQAPGTQDAVAGLTPWEVEPYRLWSLLDMYRFYGAGFAALTTRLEAARSLLAGLGSEEHGRRLLRETLEALEVASAEIALPFAFREQVKRLRVRTSDPESEIVALIPLTSELQANLVNELTSYLFFAVPPSRKRAYLTPTE